MMMQSPKANEGAKIKVFSPDSGYVRKSLKGLFPETSGSSFRSKNSKDILPPSSPEKKKTSASPEKKKTSSSPEKKKSRRSVRERVRRASTTSNSKRSTTTATADDNTSLIDHINSSEDAFVYHQIKNMSIDERAELLGRVMEKIAVDERKEESEQQKRSSKKKNSNKKLGLLRKTTTPSEGEAAPQGDGSA